MGGGGGGGAYWRFTCSHDKGIIMIVITHKWGGGGGRIGDLHVHAIKEL